VVPAMCPRSLGVRYVRCSGSLWHGKKSVDYFSKSSSSKANLTRRCARRGGDAQRGALLASPAPELQKSGIGTLQIGRDQKIPSRPISCRSNRVPASPERSSHDDYRNGFSCPRASRIGSGHLLTPFTRGVTANTRYRRCQPLYRDNRRGSIGVAHHKRLPLVESFKSCAAWYVGPLGSSRYHDRKI